jgi:hypothetical protein
VVGIRPSRRSWAKSSTAIGRGRNGRCGRGARAKRWTWAIAAPASQRVRTILWPATSFCRRRLSPKLPALRHRDRRDRFRAGGEPASRTSRRRRAQLRSWRPGRARSAYSESGAPPQMRSRQEISELSTTGSPVMQGMNGCDRYAPADLCLQPCKHLFGQTWTAVITRPATDDSDPCTGKRQEGRDRPDPAVSVNGRRTDRFLPPSRDDPARSRQPGRTI